MITPIQTRILCLAMMALFLFGCSGSGWLTQDARMHGVSFYFEPTPEDRYRFDERRMNEDLRNELRTSVSDSLALSALERIREAYNQTGQTDINIVDNPEDADLVFRIDELMIRGVRTLNVVHPGPVFRIRATISGWSGENKVFEQSHTMHNNLAVVAADGSRFYIPSSEEREDLELQQQTIYPTLRSVYGRIWQDVTDSNRKMR